MSSIERHEDLLNQYMTASQIRHSDDTPNIFATKKIFTRTECDQIWNKVKSQSADWGQISPGIPWMYLGTTVAMELARGNFDYDIYRKQSEKTNAVLKTNFSAEYDVLLRTLEEMLGEPVRFSNYGDALPGFFIFEYIGPETAEQLSKSTISKPHFDMIHLFLNLKERKVPEPYKTIAFTVPVRTPLQGSTFYHWNHINITTHSLLETIPPESLKNPYIHKLRTGEAYMHFGQELHCVAPLDLIMPGDVRVTMQGHGYHDGCGWVLFF